MQAKDANMAFDGAIVTEHASESFMTKNSREMGTHPRNTFYTHHSSLSGVDMGTYQYEAAAQASPGNRPSTSPPQ